jgi:nucleotide-binding universal stress UspA family protein
MQESNVPTGMSQLSSGSGDLLTLRNVLMCTDFSDCSTRALVYALGIATRYQAQLHVLHCIDPTPYNVGEPGAIHAACDAAWRDMRRLESDLRSKGLAKNVEVKVLVEVGDLAAILPQLTERLDLGLIVVGTHGRTGWRKLVLGSVAEIIVDHASCPVFAVGPSADRTRLQQFGPENILLASDTSNHSNLAESYAFSLARKYSSRLSVMDVLEDRSGLVRAQVSQVEWCKPESTAAILEQQLTNPPQLLTEIGTRSDLILAVADHTVADMMVFTVPATQNFTDRYLSTGAYQVVCGAPCPVLIVHAQ